MHIRRLPVFSEQYLLPFLYTTDARNVCVCVFCDLIVEETVRFVCLFVSLVLASEAEHDSQELEDQTTADYEDEGDCFLDMDQHCFLYGGWVGG